MFYAGVNNFRALAIFLIVFGHCFWISGWYPSDMAGRVYLYLLPGGTFFFVFISGFLFAHLNAPVFNYPDFVRRKARNILSPYLALSVIPVIFAVITHYPGYFTDEREGFYFQYLLPFIKYIVTGRVFTGYWYIPFIVIVFFVLSPLLVRYYRLPLRSQLIIFSSLLVISSLVHRPVDNLNPLQNLVYFIPVFLAGMVFNQQFSVFRSKLSLAWGLLLLSLALSLYQSYYLEISHNSHKAFWEYTRVDLKVFEKTLQAVAVLVLLERLFDRRYALLDLIASASFAIFFLHPVVIAVFKRLIDGAFSGFLYWHVLTVLVFFTSLLTAYILKRILGKYSRPLIGW
ncbi:acyltransferase [Chromatiaceae bacterium AAb-1]|nr:acyltransferase [Chromatiaceae bacterium AAb-1]